MKHQAEQLQLGDIPMSAKRSPAFADTDPITFGQYEARPLQDVPADYLKYLWKNELAKYSRDGVPDNLKPMVLSKVMLANYIWNSKSAIEQELGEVL
jgi:hypothetical protein